MLILKGDALMKKFNVDQVINDNNFTQTYGVMKEKFETELPDISSDVGILIIRGPFHSSGMDLE